MDRRWFCFFFLPAKIRYTSYRRRLSVTESVSGWYSVTVLTRHTCCRGTNGRGTQQSASFAFADRTRGVRSFFGYAIWCRIVVDFLSVSRWIGARWLNSKSGACLASSTRITTRIRRSPKQSGDLNGGRKIDICF